jgi:hypothetical protein
MIQNLLLCFIRFGLIPKNPLREMKQSVTLHLCLLLSMVANSYLSDYLVRYESNPTKIAMLDAAMLDTAMLDAAILDAAILDAVMLDTAMLDTAMLDAAMLDAVMLDTVAKTAAKTGFQHAQHHLAFIIQWVSSYQKIAKRQLKFGLSLLVKIIPLQCMNWGGLLQWQRLT